MMFLWAACGVPFGAYAVIQNFNIPLQVQPQCFALLSVVSWVQILLYSQYVLQPTLPPSGQVSQSRRAPAIANTETPPWQQLGYVEGDCLGRRGDRRLRWHRDGPDPDASRTLRAWERNASHRRGRRRQRPACRRPRPALRRDLETARSRRGHQLGLPVHGLLGRSLLPPGLRFVTTLALLFDTTN